jgi:hypothetical protein
MSQLSLSKEPNMVVKACFLQKGTSAPLTANDFMVRLYDKDLFDDDFLGESVPDENGCIAISFSHEAFAGDAIVKETIPDFFFVVFKNNQPVSHTKVFQDITLDQFSEFKMGEGEVIDLGTFLIELKS